MTAAAVSVSRDAEVCSGRGSYLQSGYQTVKESVRELVCVCPSTQNKEKETIISRMRVNDTVISER